MPRADVERLIMCCDRSTLDGTRDVAMLLLLALLGLRSIEVARLELSDLDWRAGELVVRGKGGREDRLPLPEDVDAGLAEYLTLRGQRAFRLVFLTLRAPTRPIRPDLVGDVVQRACRRAGVRHVARPSPETRARERDAGPRRVAYGDQPGAAPQRSGDDRDLCQGRSRAASPGRSAMARRRGMSALERHVGDYLRFGGRSATTSPRPSGCCAGSSLISTLTGLSTSRLPWRWSGRWRHG